MARRVTAIRKLRLKSWNAGLMAEQKGAEKEIEAERGY
jgi:hypothetical protein